MCQFGSISMQSDNKFLPFVDIVLLSLLTNEHVSRILEICCKVIQCFKNNGIDNWSQGATHLERGFVGFNPVFFVPHFDLHAHVEPIFSSCLNTWNNVILHSEIFIGTKHTKFSAILDFDNDMPFVITGHVSNNRHWMFEMSCLISNQIRIKSPTNFDDVLSVPRCIFSEICDIFYENYKVRPPMTTDCSKKVEYIYERLGFSNEDYDPLYDDIPILMVRKISNTSLYDNTLTWYCLNALEPVGNQQMAISCILPTVIRKSMKKTARANNIKLVIRQKPRSPPTNGGWTKTKRRR